jgi:sugar/nucleoside kinase (ribokinase family)
LDKWALNAKFIKINKYEYNRSEEYIKKELRDKLIHTSGSNGAYFKNKHFPVESKEIRDTSGAGDTFLSALAVEYLKTNNIENSIEFANKCASKVVMYRGVSVL